MHTENTTYIYDVGENDKRRLQILNDAYNPTSRRVLLHHGIKACTCILDMACGQGELTSWMAQQVAPDGIVVGVDLNDEQLSLAKERAHAHKISNVFFIKKDIFDLTPDDIYAVTGRRPDFIYCRWLLIHLEKQKIIQAMRTLYDVLAEGGRILHEEVALQESVAEKKSKAFETYVDIFLQLAERLNIDFNFGSLLSEKMEMLGYRHIQAVVSAPEWSLEQMSFFPLDLQSAVPVLEKFAISNKEKIDLLCKQLHHDQNHGILMTMVNHLVFGTKKVHPE